MFQNTKTLLIASIILAALGAHHAHAGVQELQTALQEVSASLVAVQSRLVRLSGPEGLQGLHEKLQTLARVSSPAGQIDFSVPDNWPIKSTLWIDTSAEYKDAKQEQIEAKIPFMIEKIEETLFFELANNEVRTLTAKFIASEPTIEAPAKLTDPVTLMIYKVIHPFYRGRTYKGERPTGKMIKSIGENGESKEVPEFEPFSGTVASAEINNTAQALKIKIREALLLKESPQLTTTHDPEAARQAAAATLQQALIKAVIAVLTHTPTNQNYLKFLDDATFATTLATQRAINDHEKADSYLKDLLEEPIDKEKAVRILLTELPAEDKKEVRDILDNWVKKLGALAQAEERARNAGKALKLDAKEKTDVTTAFNSLLEKLKLKELDSSEKYLRALYEKLEGTDKNKAKEYLERLRYFKIFCEQRDNSHTIGRYIDLLKTKTGDKQFQVRKFNLLALLESKTPSQEASFAKFQEYLKTLLGRREEFDALIAPLIVTEKLTLTFWDDEIAALVDAINLKSPSYSKMDRATFAHLQTIDTQVFKDFAITTLGVDAEQFNVTHEQARFARSAANEVKSLMDIHGAFFQFKDDKATSQQLAQLYFEDPTVYASGGAYPTADNIRDKFKAPKTIVVTLLQIKQIYTYLLSKSTEYGLVWKNPSSESPSPGTPTDSTYSSATGSSSGGTPPPPPPPPPLPNFATPPPPPPPLPAP